MNRKIYPLALLCGVYLAGCGEKVCLTKTIGKTQQYEIHTVRNKCIDDQVVSEQEFIRASDNHLIADGYYREYFENGSIRAIAFFKNDKQDSIAIRYYRNGNKELEYYWDNGNQIGFQSTYYPNGSPKKREYILKDSIKIFTASYAENRAIKRLDGTIFYVTYDKDVDNLHRGELFIANEIIQLDDFQSNLTIRFYSPSKRKIIDTTITAFMKIGNKYLFPRMFNLNELGRYSYFVNAKLIDKANGKVLKEDSLSFGITVK